MRFYCPNCQKEYDVEPKGTITTHTGRVAYKADCPVCGQDMAEFIPPQTTKPEQTEMQKSAQTQTGEPMTPEAGIQSPGTGATPEGATATSEPAEATSAPEKTTTEQAGASGGNDPSLHAAQAELDKAASDLVENPMVEAAPAASPTKNQNTASTDMTSA